MTTTSTGRIALVLTVGAMALAGLSACVPLVVGGAAAYSVGMVSTDRRSTGAQVDDQTIELRGAVRIHDIANDQMNVSVTSYNRQVLLTGTVGSQADKLRAADAISHIDNVRSVVNELTVGPALTFQERSNDTYISGKVKASLLDAKDLFANSFKVVTENGVVYLMGIATRRETDRATDITRGVSGVTKVVRVVEIISEAELAQQVKDRSLQQSTSGSSSSAPAAAAAPAPAAASQRSNVPLPPMEPLPPLNSAPAPAGGVTTTPVR